MVKRNRISFNVNGRRIGDLSYFYSFMSQYRPPWVQIMDELEIAEKTLEVTGGDSNVIYRIFHPENGTQWKTWKPKEYVETLEHVPKDLWLYLLNEPAGSANEVPRMVNWINEVTQLLTDRGHKVVAANLPVGHPEPWQIDNGHYDSLLQTLGERSEVTRFGVHDYAAIVLPHGVGAWGQWDMLDREKVQPDKWPKPEELQAARVRRINHLWHLMRSSWFNIRAQEIGVPKHKLVVTEFGWDRLPDLTIGQNHIYDALKKRYGISGGYVDLHGFRSLGNVWNHYWPEWDITEATFHQLKWANEVYIPEYEGMLLFFWSFGDEWDTLQGANYGADRNLHEMLLEYSRALSNDEDIDEGDDRPPPPIDIVDDFSNVLRNAVLNDWRPISKVRDKNGNLRVVEAPKHWDWITEPQTSDPAEIPHVYHRDPGFGINGSYIPWLGRFVQNSVVYNERQRYLAKAVIIPRFRFASVGEFSENFHYRFIVSHSGQSVKSEWMEYMGMDWHNKRIEAMWVIEPQDNFIGTLEFQMKQDWGNTDGELFIESIELLRVPSDYGDAVQIDFNDYNEPDPEPEPVPVPPSDGEDLPETFDTLDYIRGDGRIYELQYKFYGGPGEGTQRLQTQYENESRRFFQVKGAPNSTTFQWEELFYDRTHVWRGVDLSPGGDEFYETNTQGEYGTRWIPRNPILKKKYRINPTITFKEKSTLEPVPNKEAYEFPHWLELHAIYDEYTFESGITLQDVIELRGYLDNEGHPGPIFERFFYARNYGLVGWHDPTKTQHDPKGWRSYIARKDIVANDLQREDIGLELPDMPLFEDTQFSWPVSDPRWRQVWMSSTHPAGTNVRQRPSTKSQIVGIVEQNTPVLILEGERRTIDGRTWYPVRMSVASGDYGNSGWVRRDVVNWTDEEPVEPPDVPPSPDPAPPTPPDEPPTPPSPPGTVELITIEVEYDTGNLSPPEFELIELLRQLVAVMKNYGMRVDIYED